ncbi:TonB-dependent receptor [Microscilla marina]|uniref:TonB-dependent receptor n=1 Tax=Microscilla marina TaxID=1027 RepID=UPI0003089281|nr:TonB-dependent receptor [Microscilla marina]
MRSNITFILVFLFITQIGFGQTGSIFGTIKDKANKPQSGVHLLLVKTSLGTTSDANGNYSLENIPVGNYTLMVTKVGFGKQRLPVSVKANEKTRVDISLQEATYNLDEIAVYGQRKKIVSATRTNLELLDIPMAVQVIDKQIIQQQQIINLREVFRNISGIQNTAAWGNGSRRLAVSSRGFLLTDANYRRNGLLIMNEGNHFSDHIEEVQILKGPASVLYGDVSPGGVINFVTKKPQLTDFTNLRLTMGSWGLVRPSLDFNKKLDTDGKMAMRLNATYEKANSYRDRVTNEYIMLNPSFLYRPNNKVNWTVEGIFRQDKSVEDPGIFVPGVTLEEARSIPYNRFYGNPAARNEFTETSLVSTLELKPLANLQIRLTNQYQSVPRLNRGIWQNWVHSVGDTVALSSFGINSNDPANHPSLQALDVTLVNNNQDIVLNEPIIEFGNSATFNALNNYANLLELNYSFKTGSINHSVFVGFDYTYSTDRITYERFPNSIGSFNNPDPSIMNNILELNATPSPYKDVLTRTGLNIQEQLMLFNDKLHFLLGVRFNWFKRDRDYDNESERPDDYLNVTDNPVIPRLGMVFKIKSNISIYASYAESFEVNGRHRYKPTEFLDPTLGRQFEAGVKANLLNEKLGITLAAFSLRKENQPSFILATLADERGVSYDPAEVSIDGHILYISNAQRSQGVELDFNGKITNELNVSGNYTYLQTSLLDDVIFKKGNELENAPNHSLGLWANYKFSRILKGLSLGYGVFYQAQYFGDKDNSEGQTHFANTKMSLMVGYQYKKLLLRFNIENLTDERTYFNSFGYFWLPQPPRRTLFSIHYSF